MPTSLRIGDWTLETQRSVLVRGSESIHLEPKATEVLAYLAGKPGAVVGREELLSAVWPGVVVGDDALTQAIIKLRKALGDDAQQPRYIETIPKRGYRLVATVAPPEAAVPATASRARRPAFAAGIAVAIAALIGVSAWLLRSDKPYPLAQDGKEAVPARSFPLVAVLPLANLSGDPTRDYLSDGLTADVIDALGRFAGLRVMSWNSVQPFKGREASSDAVRQALAASYVVRGAVREADGTIRVTVELSDAAKGVQLWSGRYDGQGTQLFEIQDRIVRSIVGALAVQLNEIEQQRAATIPTQSAEAYDLVLRARALMRLEQRKPNREARELLLRAQKLAPEYGDVYVGLGENEWARAAFGWIEDPAAGVQRARELARKALELPDTRAHARAHSLLATLSTHVGEPEEGLAHASRALEMNPSDVASMFRRAHALLVLGRPEEAIQTYEYGLRLEPRPSIGPHSQLVAAYYMAGRYREAVTYADIVTRMRGEWGGVLAIRAAALAQLGSLEEARRTADAVRRVEPRINLEEVGTRFRRPEDAAKLRDGLTKAGL